MNNISRRTMISNAVVAISAALLPANIAFAEAGQSDSGFMSLVPLLLIMVIFWVLLIRPQQKRMKEHADLIKAVKKGDKVITGGGIFGRVVDAQETFLVVEIADGVRIKVRQDTITGLQDSVKNDNVKKENKKNKNK